MNRPNALTGSQDSCQTRSEEELAFLNEKQALVTIHEAFVTQFTPAWRAYIQAPTSIDPAR
jgi:hypothetical protein